MVIFSFLLFIIFISFLFYRSLASYSQVVIADLQCYHTAVARAYTDNYP